MIDLILSSSIRLVAAQTKATGRVRMMITTIAFSPTIDPRCWMAPRSAKTYIDENPRVAGKPSDDFAPQTLGSILKQAGMKK